MPKCFRSITVATCWLALAATLACTPDDHDHEVITCATEFDYEANPLAGPGWSSPAPGALTLTGQFYANETVKLEYADPASGNTRTALGTPSTNRSTFTFIGLPSGPIHMVVTVSCANGIDDTHSNGDFTIQ